MRTSILTARALWELSLTIGEFALVTLVLLSPYLAEALIDRIIGL